MSTFDVRKDGALPKGAVPDLGVDGPIVIDRLTNLLTHDSRYAQHADREVALFDGRVVEGVPS